MEKIMPGGRKSKSFKQATDLQVDPAYIDLTIPRAKGDPTGQTGLIEEQAAAVGPSQQSQILAQVAGTGGMPVVNNIFDTPTQLPEQPGYVPEPTQQTVQPAPEVEITKRLITERFPELKYRFI
jgi:hypothetical protein